MTAQLLDGKATAAAVRREPAERVAKLTTTTGRPPGLGTVLVGDAPGSPAYVAGKHRDCAQAGIVAAAGSPGLITKDMLRPGAAVLDVGITRTEQGLAGDVHPDAASVAGWLAPMPKGVGPMTRARLLAHVVEAAERNANTV
ncbi:tetrahydrofolate dehydrogenase/cyclohydrolase catalytic domain-containing protein [Streptomyces sp. NPDC093586]|uniref:tetrahydrofolate dehydrogenase/cyclohydrolase catalytic domain-containing protein n=1 Tax=Streptomyces sp. NPDC093586 TaxID=3366042 RepID=UPI0038292590